MWRGEQQERNGLKSGGGRGWGSSCLVLVPVVLCPGLLGAGPADRFWHPDPSGALTPGGTSHSPSMLCTFFLNCFYYYHYFSPCSDGVSAEGEEGSKPEQSCSPSLQGWLQLHGREATFPRSAPSLGHLAENQPVRSSGRRESFPSHMLGVPGWTCPGQGTAHCRIPPFCRAGAVHPPPSRGRAVPHAFCDRCAGKGMAASRLSAAAGGPAALTCVGSGSQISPGGLGTLGCPWAC